MPDFLTWVGLCQPHQPHASLSIYEYGKLGNWTFVNGSWDDHRFCHSANRYQSWEGADRIGQQICTRRDHCKKTGDAAKTGSIHFAGRRNHEPDNCRYRIGRQCCDRRSG